MHKQSGRGNSPHNLNEVIDGAIHLIDNPDAEIMDLMNFIKGPDFPTGALIYGYEGVKEALLTGRGRVMMRAKADIETSATGHETIVVTEIPYMVNKSQLVIAIADLVKEKKISICRMQTENSISLLSS